VFQGGWWTTHLDVLLMVGHWCSCLLQGLACRSHLSATSLVNQPVLRQLIP
jgi:hypothetical protein